MRQHAKTIKKLMASYIYLAGVSVATSTADVTAAVTTALATAGSGGASVPLAVGSEASYAQGLLISSTLRLPVVDAVTLEPLVDLTNNNECYGILSEASGTYTFDVMSLSDAGVEAAADVADATMTVAVPYLFDFVNYPADSALRFSAYQVGQDSKELGGKVVKELVSVTALNTLAALSNVPYDPSLVSINIDGHIEDIAGGAFSVAGSAVTWIPLVAGYPLETTDKCIVTYYV